METFLLVRSRGLVKWMHVLWRKRLFLIPKNRTAWSGFMKINFLVSYIFPIGTLESSVKLAICITWGELHRLATVWRSLQAMDIRSTRILKIWELFVGGKLLLCDEGSRSWCSDESSWPRICSRLMAEQHNEYVDSPKPLFFVVFVSS